MVERKTWGEFRKTGLLWFVNTILHLFGWAIIYDVDENFVRDVYPARVKFRGFTGECNDEGYSKVTEYLAENINELIKETQNDGCDIH